MVVRLLVQRVLEKDIWTKVGRRKPFFSIPLSPKQRFIFSDIDKQRTSFYFILHADFQWLSAINGDVISLMLGGNYWSTLIKIIPLTAWRISESTTGDCGQQGAWRKHSYKSLVPFRGLNVDESCSDWKETRFFRLNVVGLFSNYSPSWLIYL